MDDAQHTVTDDSSVDDESQQGLLIGSSVVLQQSRGVVVTDSGVRGALGDRTANSCGDSESLEKHDR